MDNIIFNPNYVVKPDKGYALLLPSSVGRVNGAVRNGSEFIIHPIHAVILNAISGKDNTEVMNEITSTLHVNQAFVQKFILSLLDNDKYVKIKDSKTNDTYIFPPNTIITANEKSYRKKISQSQFFNGETNLRRKRHFTPTDITLMLNNKCVTDCFYCYADKRHPIDCNIPFERLKELIVEARNIHVNNFDVIGGEFFLYKYWAELLSLLGEYDYYPYLSTKMPLGEEVIKKLAKQNIIELQVSLDTLINEHLCSMLRVNSSYLGKIINMFELLEKYNISIYVHTILTRKNDTVEDVSSVFNFLSKFHNISSWKIDIASPSLYKSESYENIRSRYDNVLLIDNYLSNIKKQANFSVIYGNISRRTTYFSEISEHDKMKAFENRARCSANYSGFFILPDGNVTICEELYWHPRFLIGNVKEQGLLEIWNSDKALDLFYLSQKKIREDSKCSKCDIFAKCRMGKGICWKSVIGFYGLDKWDYPDPLCTINI